MMAAHYRPYHNSEDDELDDDSSVQFYDKMAQKVFPGRRLVVGSSMLAIICLSLGIAIGYYSHEHQVECNQKEKVVMQSVQEEHPYITQLLHEEISGANIEEYLKSFSHKGHYAGSKDAKDEAGEIVLMWQTFGLDKVDIPKYQVMMSYPDLNHSSFISILDEKNQQISQEWRTTNELADLNILPAFFAYSASALVAGPLVYGYYGQYKDFQRLKAPNLNGTVLLVKLAGQVPGDVVRLAEEHGCVAVLFFSPEPEHLGGIPSNASVRGTAIASGITLGDPLTPGFASKPDTYRLPRESVKAFPRIPVHSISYQVADELLRNITGQPFKDWPTKLQQGTISSDKKVKVSVRMVEKQVEIRNVIGWIRGNVEPDRYVMVGAPRDSSVFGAEESSGGSAILMELVRTYGAHLKAGWRPRRSVVFCSWGAAEPNLIGSTEWVEEHLPELRERAVAYIHLGKVVLGNRTLRAEASPLLSSALYNVTQLIPNPMESELLADRKTIFDTWLAEDAVSRYPDSRLLPYQEDEELDSDPAAKLELEVSLNQPKPRVDLPVAVADYAPFVVMAGVPVVSLQYVGSHSVLNFAQTQYDTANQVKKLDSGLQLHLAIAQTTSELVRDLSDSLFIPFSPLDYRVLLNVFLSNLEIILNQHGASEDVRFEKESLESAALNFSHQAVEFHIQQRMHGSSYLKDPMAIRELNDRVIGIERAFLDPEGLPSRGIYKHVVLSRSLSPMQGKETFPGIMDLLRNVNEIDWNKVRQHLAVLGCRLQGAAEILRSICCEDPLPSSSDSPR